MHQLPRRFHSLTPAEQAAALLVAPPLTGTRWDALLAAAVEHVAWLHGHLAPDWCAEAERFLDIPWVISTNPVTAADSLGTACCPTHPTLTAAAERCRSGSRDCLRPGGERRGANAQRPTVR